MKEGDIVLIDLLQSDGNLKLRPALILKKLPKYNDFLVCGISTQLHQYIKNDDEILDGNDTHFHHTGLYKTSLVRLFFWPLLKRKRLRVQLERLHQPCIKTYLKDWLNSLLVVRVYRGKRNANVRFLLLKIYGKGRIFYFV